MSQQGINLAAGALLHLQNARHEIMAIACPPGYPTQGGRPIDKQDILLSHLMEKAKEAIKTEFGQIVQGHYPDGTLIK